MNRKEFFEKVANILRDDESHNYLQKIQRAYWLAKLVHKDQKRDVGERYFEHCRRTALYFIEHLIFVENKLSKSVLNLKKWRGVKRWHSIVGCMNSYCRTQIIMMALLHDCVEDSFIPNGILSTECFDFVGINVERMSKIKPVFDVLTGAVKKNVRKSDNEYYREISASTFASYVKIFDRLDNLHSMKAVWPKARQVEYIIETEKYILPIAEKTDNELCRVLRKEIRKLQKKEGE